MQGQAIQTIIRIQIFFWKVMVGIGGGGGCNLHRNKEVLRQGPKQKFACISSKATDNMNKPVEEQTSWGGL